ncbi:hypothetical protein NLI96_g3327 [Meripilus lineatus]|uniref:Uncharacterized protein n=1 Tax=Meripilus lineatus TaxID=2056292 RepID=A0AAD5YL44_9APHY|nr:hypothetical protein NLI96_g3327 [Physisporinus lineatus]
MENDLQHAVPFGAELSPVVAFWADTPLAELLDRAVDGDIRPQDIVDILCVRMNNMLLPYVDDPCAFRELLDATDSALSGSYVARLLEGPTDWMERDLDIYVDPSSVDRVRQYLEALGYVRASPAQQHSIYDHGGGSIREVIKMKKEGLPRTIDIIVSRSKLSIAPIADFWGTHVMNFVTGSTLCIAYPHTLDHIGLLVPRRSGDWKVPILIGKYEQRGYEFEEPDADELGKVRYFGDKDCLRLPIRRGGLIFGRGPIVNTVVWKL